MAAVRIPLFFFFFFFFFFSFNYSQPSENQALLKLKQSFPPDSKSLISWTGDSIPCAARWTGIICHRGRITGLHLTGLRLSGTIDVDALLQLPDLRTISLVNNSFSGPIPDFNRIGVLKSLLLSGNEFSGVVPADYFASLTSLKKVWLAFNKFSGEIPPSLVKLSHLIELHLEGNEFSGKIPDLQQTSILSLDLSDNKLEGEIPSSLSRFDPKAFAGNEGLCGKPLEKACGGGGGGGGDGGGGGGGVVVESNDAPAPPPPVESKGNVSKFFVATFIAIAVFVIVFLLLSASRRREDEFRVLGRDGMEEVVEVHVPSAAGGGYRDQSSRRGGGGGGGGDSRRGGSQHGGGKGATTDLVVVNDEKGTFGMGDLMKAAAEVLGNGGLGSAYKATMSNGVSVVVKRMKEMNKLGKDGFDAEMRRLGKLRHHNVLTPLAYHYRREEKLLVSEYVPKSSLLYVLHGDRGSCHAELNWATRLRIVKGIARGLGFLHSEFATYDLPHGNLKSSNVLLDDNYEPLLNDYAFHPLINPSNATQSMFAYKSPEYTKHQEISPKSDVYCLGVIILEILTGKFPSQYLASDKGGTDVVQWVSTAVADNREAELIDPEIATEASSIHRMVDLLRIGAECARDDPHQRPEVREVIRRVEEI